MEDKRWRWILVTAIAPIAWGSGYVVTRSLLPADAPLWGGVLRALPAGLLVLLIARRLPAGSWWWRSLVLGALNVGGFFVLVYVAGQRLPSSLAATLMSASAAGMLLFGWLLLHRRPRLAAAVGAAVGLVGVGVMLGFDADGADPWGVAASLGAMVAASLGFVLTSRWGSGVPALPMTAWQLIGGSIVLIPAALLVEGAPPALTATSALGFAYLTLIATAVAYVAWFAGLRRLSPGVVGVVGLLNPVTGVVLGVVLAGEAFGMPQIVGVALVLAGIVLGAAPARQRGALGDAPADAVPPLASART
ncbi:EamA family transporter [Microbacterium sp. M3]|uniref:EamA family transporter n=1 Tax=Microbacterium arthrosphaerae TaxID=792652 RepID=A0ABU4GWI9_9MICO|nr:MULTISPECIES: EamA family transporter [Microbacterium]MDW4571431.1 EamA family transporter [Microbacterium arthrosphaerae]MDW7605286.1 EamA family transporter [Microbacterium sp. M3]